MAKENLHCLTRLAVANDQHFINVIVMRQARLKVKLFLELESKWEKISIMERHGRCMKLAQKPCAECRQEFALWEHTKWSTAVNFKIMSIKYAL
jgi:hypothetical protein